MPAFGSGIPPRRRAFGSGVPTMGVGSFEPTDISGLGVWHRADRGTTLSASNVTQWNDLSGNGRHLTQGTDANRFALVSGVINGRPVLRPGADSFMSYTAWAMGTAFTVFAVVRFTARGSDYQKMIQQSSNPGVYLANSTQLRRPTLYHAGNILVWGADLSDATNYLVKWTIDYSGSPEQFAIQVNGSAEETTTQAGPLTAGNFVGLGESGVQQIISDVAEVIIYMKDTSAAEDLQIRNYTRSLYAISM